MFKNFTIKKGLFVIVVVTLSIFVTGCDKAESEKEPTSAESYIETAIEKAHRQAAINSAYGILDAAKYAYIESLLTEKPITYGNVSDLKVNGTLATSGTWKVNTDNNSMSTIILKDVVIGDYICNTIGKEIECKKR